MIIFVCEADLYILMLSVCVLVSILNSRQIRWVTE